MTLQLIIMRTLINNSVVLEVVRQPAILSLVGVEIWFGNDFSEQIDSCIVIQSGFGGRSGIRFECLEDREIWSLEENVFKSKFE